MPGFSTHYLFGAAAYRSISDINTQNIIANARGPYGLGLQGPDFFFYYLPSYLIHRKNMGGIAHDFNTGLFFKNLLDSRNLFQNRKNRRIAEAYILGFLGHYCLDCACHPYVYARTKFKERSQAYSSRHMTLETDIDKLMLKHNKNISPSEFSQAVTIRLNKREIRIISSVLHYTFSNTFRGYYSSYFMMRSAIASMRLGLKLLKDPTGRKKPCMRNLEKYITGYAAISPIIPSDRITYYSDCCNLKKRTWVNPWDPGVKRSESLFELVETAEKSYLKLLHLAGNLFKNPSNEYDSSALSLLLHTIGNKSYHSGMEAAKL